LSSKHRKRAIITDIAKERIIRLLKMAYETFTFDRKLAKRYIEIACKISMKCKVRIPRKWRRWICKKCKTLLLPGVNCRVRIRQRRTTHIAVTCLECGHIKRYIIRK